MSRKHRGGWSRLSGSTKRRIEKIIAKGWMPPTELPQCRDLSGKGGDGR